MPYAGGGEEEICDQVARARWRLKAVVIERNRSKAAAAARKNGIVPSLVKCLKGKKVFLKALTKKLIFEEG